MVSDEECRCIEVFFHSDSFRHPLSHGSFIVNVEFLDDQLGVLGVQISQVSFCPGALLAAGLIEIGGIDRR